MSHPAPLHLQSPVGDRGFCGRPSTQLVGVWKCRAILFVRKEEWDAMCLSCKARAAEWMRANDASTAPVFPVSFADIKAAYLAALGDGKEDDFGPMGQFVRAVLP